MRPIIQTGTHIKFGLGPIELRRRGWPRNSQLPTERSLLVWMREETDRSLYMLSYDWVLEKAGDALFGEVTDPIRAASRIAQGRILRPEMIREVCNFGFRQIFQAGI